MTFWRPSLESQRFIPKSRRPDRHDSSDLSSYVTLDTQYCHHITGWHPIIITSPAVHMPREAIVSLSCPLYFSRYPYRKLGILERLRRLKTADSPDPDCAKALIVKNE
jgi:hypothetical protein